MEPSCGEAVVGGKEGSWWVGRAEIDTSAPFASVKAAVDHFGGSGRWRSACRGQRSSCSPESSHEDINVASVEDETAQLQKALVVKEQETLEVLKELEMTKKTVDGLKLKLQKEERFEQIALSTTNLDSTKVHPITEIEHEPSRSAALGSTKRPSPSLILMELKQAKLQLNRTTSDLAGIRSSIESINHELKVEKMSLKKAGKSLASKSTLISNLEKELSHTRFILHLAKDAGTITAKNPPEISRKLHELRSESEQFKRITETAKSEAMKLSGDIEQMRTGIKTTEVRLLAARKMEAAARATESSVKAEIKALMNSGNTALGSQNPVGVTLSMEEYNILVRRAQGAENLSRKRIEASVAQVEEATKSKTELLKRVEEAKTEVRTGKKALSEALCRVEVANKAKLAVEEALRKWRSDNRRRRSVHSSPRFKNSFSGHHRRDSKTRDLNALGVSTSYSDNTNKSSALAPTLSIGQILSRKLVGPEDYEIVGRGRDSVSARPKVSLGQMLSRRQGISSSETSMDGITPQGQFQRKRRFGLVSILLILAKHKKGEKKKSKRKKKRHAWSPK